MNLPNTEEQFIAYRSNIERFILAELFDEATLLANKYLEVAQEMKQHWNYGNAIHHGNMYLGYLALIRGEIKLAQNHLLESGKTPGSPQLNSFGPNMLLAKKLLKIGSRDVVIEYLNSCKEFWKAPFSKIESWISEIDNGNEPDFRSNLGY